MPKVLVFSRDPAWYGGVVYFIVLLRRSLSNSVTSEHFLVGRRKSCNDYACRILQPVVDMFRLLWIVRSGRYDLFHLNPSLNGPSLWRDGLFLTVLRLRKSGRVIVFFHGWEASTETRIGNSSLLHFLFRSTFASADRCLVLSHSVKKALVALGGDAAKIAVISTMFDAEELRLAERQQSGSTIRVLFLSRFTREKGVYELLCSMRDIVRGHTDVRLILAGDGPEMQRMQEWVTENSMSSFVEFTGYVRGEAKIRTMVRSDIFVLPSYTEGCPVSLLEAMAVGMPIVASAVGAIPELLCDGVNGYLIPHVDPASITEALIPLLANSALRSAIGKTNRKIAWEKYSSDRVARAMEDIYAEVVGIG